MSKDKVIWPCRRLHSHASNERHAVRKEGLWGHVYGSLVVLTICRKFLRKYDFLYDLASLSLVWLSLALFLLL